MGDVNEFEGHAGSSFHGVFIAAGGTETTVAAKWDKLHFSAGRAAIHGSAIGRVTAIDHFIHVLDYRSTGVENINHFFIMFFKNSLEDIHKTIVEEMEEKRKPHPSRLRGRGVEVSKTLF